MYSEEQKNAFKIFARTGGLAVLKKRGKKHFSEMGKRSGEVRKLLKSQKTA